MLVLPSHLQRTGELRLPLRECESVHKTGSHAVSCTVPAGWLEGPQASCEFVRLRTVWIQGTGNTLSSLFFQ